MGIPAYFSYIIKNHPNIIRNYNHFLNENNIDNLYFDSNSIIYDCLRDLVKIEYIHGTNKFEHELICMVCNKLLSYINIIKPTKNIIIAFDGVAPVAKMEQQRCRRYKTIIEKKILKKIKNIDEHFWDKTCITPGTNFMNKLNINVTKFFKDIKLNVENIIVLGSNIPGEGEHKLFDYIKNNKSIHYSTSTVVYGLDADLIMLGLLHSHYCKSIYLYRETPEFIKQLNKQLNNNKQYFLNIQIFKKEILKKMNIGEIQVNYQKNRLYDYIFLCFLLGNDFLPHFPALNLRKNGMNTILDCYDKTIKKTTKSIIYKNTIQWPLFRKFVAGLIKQEEELIKADHTNKISKIHHSWTIEEKLNRLPQYSKRTEQIIQVGKTGWQERYYQELFFVDKTPKICKSICQNYLEGLEWTFKYYTTGCCNWDWSYKWSYPPLLQDLYLHVPIKYKQFIKENNNSIHPVVQLAYVLPPIHHHLLDTTLAKKLRTQYGRYYVGMPNEDGIPQLDFIWAFCRYFWECHVHLPEIPEAMLKDINGGT